MLRVWVCVCVCVCVWVCVCSACWQACVCVLRCVTQSVCRCDDVKRLMKADETLWASDHRALVVQFRCA